MRRSPMTRSRKPLRRRTRLETRTPLKPVSDRRAAQLAVAGKRVVSTLTGRPRPAVPANVRAALRKRATVDGIPLCEIALPGCLGHGTDPAHRITTKAGGRHGHAKVEHDRLSDVLLACRFCHETTQGDHQTHGAHGTGLVLKEHHNPLQVPVLYRGEPAWLTDDGRVVPLEEAA